MILGFDRQVDRAILAIDVDDHRGDRVAFLEVRPDVFNTVARDFGRTKVAFDVAIERDDRTLAVERLDRAGHDGAFIVSRDEVGEGIAIELLDAERDALAFDIDGEHHRLDLLPLAIFTYCGFAGQRPG